MPDWLEAGPGIPQPALPTTATIERTRNRHVDAHRPADTSGRQLPSAARWIFVVKSAAGPADGVIGRLVSGFRLVYAPPKGGKTREVPLPGSPGRLLKDHMKAYSPVLVTLPWGIPAGEPESVQLI